MKRVIKVDECRYWGHTRFGREEIRKTGWYAYLECGHKKFYQNIPHIEIKKAKCPVCDSFNNVLRSGRKRL